MLFSENVGLCWSEVDFTLVTRPKKKKKKERKRGVWVPENYGANCHPTEGPDDHIGWQPRMVMNGHLVAIMRKLMIHSSCSACCMESVNSHSWTNQHRAVVSGRGEAERYKRSWWSELKSSIWRKANWRVLCIVECYVCIVTHVTWMFCIHGRYLMQILLGKNPNLNICLFFDAV